MFKNIDKNDRFYLEFFICLLLCIASIPFAFFIKEKNNVLLVSIVLRLFFIAFVLFYLKKIGMLSIKFKFSIKHILFIPLFVLTFSNLIVTKYNNTLSFININYYEFFLNLLYCLVIAFSEELIFRFLVFRLLIKYYPREKIIFISAIIFSFAHFLNFFSNFDIVTTLMQCGYTFILGLILGFIYCHSENILYSSLYHTLFNFINGFIFINFSSQEWDKSFFIINVIIGFIVLIYIFILILIFRRCKKDVTRHLDF